MFTTGWLAAGAALTVGARALTSNVLASFVAGAWLVGGAWMISHFISLEGSLYRRMGGTAEEWTAEAFGKLRKYGWTSFHNIVFSGGDVDHVVIGPQQVLAVETKFTAQPLDVDAKAGLVRPRQEWLQQAHRGARKTRLLLRSYGIDQEVTPVLALWGPGVSSSERAWAEVDGVPVLIGARAKEWSAGLRKMPWSKQPTHQARQALEDHLAKARRRAPSTR